MQAIIDSATREILGVGIFTANPPEGQELVNLTPAQEARLQERGLKYHRQGGTLDVVLPQYALDDDARIAGEHASRATAIALLKPIAQGAVGKNVTALSAVEVRALMAVMIWRMGGLDGAGNVRPLAQWTGE